MRLNKAICEINKKTPVPGIFVRVSGNETKTGAVRILVIFQDRPMFSHIIQKLSPRPFK